MHLDDNNRYNNNIIITIIYLFRGVRVGTEFSCSVDMSIQF